MTNTEKRLESPRSFGDSRMSGKSTSQGIFLLECIYKGEKYTVFDSIRNKVHIIPDKHLKEIIAQALAEERERVREESTLYFRVRQIPLSEEFINIFNPKDKDI